MVFYSAGQYQYTGHLLALSNCRPRAGTVPREVCSLRTPLVEWAKWARYLEAHPAAQMQVGETEHGVSQGEAEGGERVPR